MEELRLESNGVLDYLDEYADIICCPKCSGQLARQKLTIECKECHSCYGITNNVPLLFWAKEWASDEEDVTEKMRAFYEENPFPDYDDLDDVSSLMQKAKRGVFANMLDAQIPFGARVLDCGCGTGQLSIFLSVAQRTVFGVDMCLNSLRLAEAFKEKNGLNRVHFLQMNLFAPIFRAESFDLVICNGVLHHTRDPFLGFQNIARLVKPDGYILIGLYHRYGRFLTNLRRFAFNVSKDSFKFLDARLRDRAISQRKRNTWFADQYKNPHESEHTMGEILKWFGRTGFNFVTSIPSSVPARPFTTNQKLFFAQRPGNSLERFLVEFPMILTNSRDGGLFIMIGRRSLGTEGGNSARSPSFRKEH